MSDAGGRNSGCSLARVSAVSWRKFFFLLIILAVSGARNYTHDDIDSPVFPSSFPANNFDENGTYHKHIPRNIWIAVRNISDGRPVHLIAFAKKNINWTMNYCDNDMKDEFMDTVFANTSLLWAYHIINPLLGTS
jgi:hypothetical protein